MIIVSYIDISYITICYPTPGYSTPGYPTLGYPTLGYDYSLGFGLWCPLSNWSWRLCSSSLGWYSTAFGLRFGLDLGF